MEGSLTSACFKFGYDHVLYGIAGLSFGIGCLGMGVIIRSGIYIFGEHLYIYQVFVNW